MTWKVNKSDPFLVVPVDFEGVAEVQSATVAGVSSTGSQDITALLEAKRRALQAEGKTSGELRLHVVDGRWVPVDA